MQITADMVKQLRSKTAAGLMDCKEALAKTDGNVEKAYEILRAKGFAEAEKKAQRVANQGLIEAYIHPGGRLGALIELNCESDFVARTDEFKNLAHELAMQVAAMSPQYLAAEEIPSGTDLVPNQACLLLQPYIKDPTRSIKDLITEVVAKVGENIKVRRFARFELGM